MSQLLIIDGGSRTLDTSKATIAHIYRPEYLNGQKREKVWFFIDDVEKQERLVLEVNHVSTLKGNKPKESRDRVVLTTIHGYNPEKNNWGPQQSISGLDISWKNGKRLIDEVTAHAQANFSQFDGGTTWYAKNHHYL